MSLELSLTFESEACKLVNLGNCYCLSGVVYSFECMEACDRILWRLSAKIEDLFIVLDALCEGWHCSVIKIESSPCMLKLSSLSNKLILLDTF